MFINKDAVEYIKSDYYRYTGKKSSFIKIIIYLLIARNHCFNYLFWLRLASKKNCLSHLATFVHNRLSVKYGIHIPVTTNIGYGFYIGHGVSIVINGQTKIGNNVNISQFLSIGSNKDTPATIGDNVYIGPHVCIVEDVKIGSNVTIGAGAVIVNDVTDWSTVVGVPAKNIGINKHPEYIKNRWSFNSVG